MKKLILSAISALAIGTGAALAAGGGGHVEDHAFSFEGPSGNTTKSNCVAASKFTAKSARAATG